MHLKRYAVYSNWQSSLKCTVMVIFDPVMHQPVFEACVNDTVPESFVMQRINVVCATSLSEVSSPLSEAFR